MGRPLYTACLDAMQHKQRFSFYLLVRTLPHMAVHRAAFQPTANHRHCFSLLIYFRSHIQTLPCGFYPKAAMPVPAR